MCDVSMFHKVTFRHRPPTDSQDRLCLGAFKFAQLPTVTTLNWLSLFDFEDRPKWASDSGKMSWKVRKIFNRDPLSYAGALGPLRGYFSTQAMFQRRLYPSIEDGIIGSAAEKSIVLVS